jgi:uncharacterized protein (TIGR04222 family)
MMRIAAASGIWGISGAEFVVLYVALAVVVGAAVVLVRRWLRAGRDGNPRAIGADLEARPTDVGYLNGGPPLAVLAALGTLRAAGVVEVGEDGQLRVLAAPLASMGPLPRAVYAAVEGGATGWALRRDAGVRAVLERTGRRLVSGGLVTGTERRRAQRLAALALAAVSVFGGGAWWTAETRHDGVVGVLSILGVLCVLVALVSVALLVRVPQRTLTGDRVLAALRSMRASTLAPRGRRTPPDRRAPSPESTALGVALSASR